MSQTLPLPGNPMASNKASSPATRHSENAAFKDVTFAKIDVDTVPQVAEKFKIRAMPTFMLLKNGEKVEELLGANPPGLKALVEKAI